MKPPTLTIPLAWPSREAGANVRARSKPIIDAGTAEPGGDDQHARAATAARPRASSSTTVQVGAIAPTMASTTVERCHGCRLM